MEGTSNFIGTVITTGALFVGGLVGYGQLRAEVNNVKEDVVELSEDKNNISINKIKIENIENDVAECKVTLHNLVEDQSQLAQEIQRISTTLDLIRQDIRNGNGH